MIDRPFVRLGPAQATQPLVLDSPHSGHEFPDDFGAAVGERDLREGEDCHVDRLYAPAAELGIPLLAATFPRTYIDVNRHEDDIDPAVLADPWPKPLRDSGKSAIGKALVWRALDDGRPIYDRRLPAAEIQRRIDRFHRPYHAALGELIADAHRRFGRTLHLNLHSMRAVSGVLGVGGPGQVRPDVVLGDRDGTSCDPALTDFVARTLSAMGYQVRINDPYKGMELVRAFADPAHGRHSLQIELNRRLYMDEATLEPSPNFAVLQGDLMQMIDVLRRHLTEDRRP